jgi:hypothetical protein
MVLLCFAPVKHDERNSMTTQQRNVGNGRAYPHRIPLAKLKCISPRGWKDLAARRRGRSRAARGAYNPLAMLSAPARYFDLVREMKNAYNHAEAFIPRTVVQ